MKPRRSAQMMIEVKEEELQLQKDKLAYLRQVKQMKQVNFKKEDEEEEKHAKQDEHPEPANVEAVRQEMSRYYEEQLAQKNREQEQKDADMIAKLNALYHRVAEGGNATAAQSVFLETWQQVQPEHLPACCRRLLLSPIKQAPSPMMLSRRRS